MLLFLLLLFPLVEFYFIFSTICLDRPEVHIFATPNGGPFSAKMQATYNSKQARYSSSPNMRPMCTWQAKFLAPIRIRQAPPRGFLSLSLLHAYICGKRYVRPFLCRHFRSPSGLCFRRQTVSFSLILCAPKAYAGGSSNELTSPRVLWREETGKEGLLYVGTRHLQWQPWPSATAQLAICTPANTKASPIMPFQLNYWSIQVVGNEPGSMASPPYGYSKPFPCTLEKGQVPMRWKGFFWSVIPSRQEPPLAGDPCDFRSQQ